MSDDTKGHDRSGTPVRAHEIIDGRKVVTTAGTAVAISSTNMIVDYVIITAETNNTGAITVGASTVVEAVATRRGTPLNAGDSISLGAVNLADVYIDSGVNGDGVTYTALK